VLVKRFWVTPLYLHKVECVDLCDKPRARADSRLWLPARRQARLLAAKS
jgi:hypothetical protein